MNDYIIFEKLRLYILDLNLEDHFTYIKNSEDKQLARIYSDTGSGYVSIELPELGTINLHKDRSTIDGGYIDEKQNLEQYIQKVAGIDPRKVSARVRRLTKPFIEEADKRAERAKKDRVAKLQAELKELRSK